MKQADAIDYSYGYCIDAIRVTPELIQWVGVGHSDAV
jgi:hypothetical protein